MRTESDLREKLGEQSRFLSRSLNYFMRGDMSETLRLATVMRTLVHDTANSTALLKQITPGYLDLKIRSRPQPKRLDVTFMYYGGQLKWNTDTGKVMPHIDLNGPRYEEMGLGDWWTAVGIVLRASGIAEPVFQRKLLVRTLADQEGGTHVDPELSRDYVRLVRTSPMGMIFDGKSVPLPNLARCFVGESAARTTSLLAAII